MVLSTSILVFGPTIQSQKRGEPLLLKKITSFTSYIFTFYKNLLLVVDKNNVGVVCNNATIKVNLQHV
jgi:hypothetical protein